MASREEWQTLVDASTPVDTVFVGKKGVGEDSGLSLAALAVERIVIPSRHAPAIAEKTLNAVFVGHLGELLFAPGVVGTAGNNKCAEHNWYHLMGDEVLYDGVLLMSFYRGPCQDCQAALSSLASSKGQRILYFADTVFEYSAGEKDDAAPVKDPRGVGLKAEGTTKRAKRLSSGLEFFRRMKRAIGVLCAADSSIGHRDDNGTYKGVQVKPFYQFDTDQKVQLGGWAQCNVHKMSVNCEHLQALKAYLIGRNADEYTAVHYIQSKTQ